MFAHDKINSPESKDSDEINKILKFVGHNATKKSYIEAIQKDEARKKHLIEISQIFKNINEVRKVVRQEDKSAGVDPFDQLLTGYKQALIEEVCTIPSQYHHPVNAAKALERVFTDTSTPVDQRIHHFEKEGVNTGFYPKTKALAASLAFFLAVGALVVGICLLAGVPLAVSVGIGCAVIESACIPALPFSLMYFKLPDTAKEVVTNTKEVSNKLRAEMK